MVLETRNLSTGFGWGLRAGIWRPRGRGMRSTAAACWRAGWARGRTRAQGSARRTWFSRSCQLPSQHHPIFNSGVIPLCLGHCIMEALLLAAAFHTHGVGCSLFVALLRILRCNYCFIKLVCAMVIHCQSKSNEVSALKYSSRFAIGMRDHRLDACFEPVDCWVA